MTKVREAIRETADDLARLGLLDAETHTKITLRQMPQSAREESISVSPEEIRLIRERARMSQAVFGRHLAVSTGYVSQLERGTKTPSGPVRVLLDLMRRKGVEAIL
jgi:putative transcriptional regulator